MDTVFERRRLRAAFALLLLAVLACFAGRADATTAQEAHDACMGSSIVALRNGSCAVISADGGGHQRYELWGDSGGVPPVRMLYGYYYFEGLAPLPSGACDTAPTRHIYLDGEVLEGSSTCVRGPVQKDGSQAMCGVLLSPISPPTFNPNMGGHWETYASYAPTGTVCGLGSGADPGTVVGPDGGPSLPASDLPSQIPTPTPPDNPAPPKLCDGLSCYDPGSDQYCSTSGGSQFCVSGSDARGGSGACSSSGNAVLCAGSPHAPAPPSPPISDPATQVKDNTTVSQVNSSTGAALPVNVVVFATPGTSVESGQQAGDSGPAPASSTNPAPSSVYAGGGDCNSPPVCSGDAVMCGIARETWNAGCKSKKGLDQLHTDIAGTTAPPSLTDGAHSSSDVWQGVSTGSVIGDAANGGNYDQTGMGFATACPLHDMNVSLWDGRSFSINFAAGCEVGGWIKALVIAFALFAAARITAGGTN